MNKALQSYTPVPRPLYYDSLEAAVGTESESGNDYYGSLAFEWITVRKHDPNDSRFDQPDTISYSMGPAVPGDPTKPFKTQWVAWQATKGIRVGNESVTPPADDKGSLSGLFPTGVYTKVTHGFNENGMLAIAIEKDGPFVEVRWHVDEFNQSSLSFPGSEPCLFYTGLIESGDPGEGRLMCYYSKPDMPKRLYARFQHEGFEVEYVIHPELRISIERIITTYADGRYQIMLMVDSLGRDVILTSPNYALYLEDSTSVDMLLEGGEIEQIVVDAPIPLEKSTLVCGLEGGRIIKAVALAKAIPLSKSTLTLSLEGGEITLP